MDVINVKPYYKMFWWTELVKRISVGMPYGMIFQQTLWYQYTHDQKYGAHHFSCNDSEK